MSTNLTTQQAAVVAVDGFMTRRTLVSGMQCVSARVTNTQDTKSARLVRASSRRMIVMRFRPSYIRVINRRDDRLDRHLRCLLKPKPYIEQCRKHRYRDPNVDALGHITKVPSVRAVPSEGRPFDIAR